VAVLVGIKKVEDTRLVHTVYSGCVLSDILHELRVLACGQLSRSPADLSDASSCSTYDISARSLDELRLRCSS